MFGFPSDCLTDKLGLNFSRIIGLRAEGPHTDRMYNRTLASAYTVVRPLMKFLALITLLLSMSAAAKELSRLEKPELATVLGLHKELASTTPRSEQPYFVRVFSVPVGVYECGGSVESCPDVRLFVTVSFGDIGETPALFELPAQKGWEFIGWVAPSASGDERMASFKLRTAIPEANIDLEARRAWVAEEYSVLVSPGSASYERR